jgi:hypothetical protein
MKIETSLVNHDSQSLIADTRNSQTRSAATPVFILCDKCIDVLHILESQETDRLDSNEKLPNRVADNDDKCDNNYYITEDDVVGELI